MSAKRWADEYSSDEGSIDPESDEESVPKVAPLVATKSVANSNSAPPGKTAGVQPVRPEQYIAYISSINPAATRTDVGRFFEEKSCAIANLDVHLVPNRNSTATMEFKDANSLSIALTLNGETFQGIPIRTKVFEVRSHQLSHHGGPGLRQQPQQGGRGGGFRDNRDAPRGPGRNEEERFPGRRQDAGRDGGRGRGGGAGTSRERPMREAASAPAAPPVPATRPKLNLAPRTLPVDLIGKAVAEETKPDIFGGGKPHDDALYEEKKKVIDPKEEPSAAVPASVFELSALQSALPGDEAAAAPAEAEATTGTATATTAVSSAEAPTPQSDARPVKGGRGAGRESAERWSKEAPRGGGGRGGGGAGAGGRGPGRTVEVTTGSYVIEKPLDDDESGSRGGGKGPVKSAAGRKGPKDSSTSSTSSTREESAKGFAAAGKHSKPAPPSSSAREVREPRQHARPADTAASGDAGEGSGAKDGTGSRPKSGAKDGTGSRPKSGGPGSKLFDSAMKQANPKLKKPTGNVSVTVSAEALAEERFNKAQESFAGKGAYKAGGSGSTPTAAAGGAGGAAAAVKKSNSFAALVDHSDSEDE